MRTRFIIERPFVLIVLFGASILGVFGALLNTPYQLAIASFLTIMLVTYLVKKVTTVSNLLSPFVLLFFAWTLLGMVYILSLGFGLVREISISTCIYILLHLMLFMIGTSISRKSSLDISRSSLGNFQYSNPPIRVIILFSAIGFVGYLLGALYYFRELGFSGFDNSYSLLRFEFLDLVGVNQRVPFYGFLWQYTSPFGLIGLILGVFYWKKTSLVTRFVCISPIISATIYSMSISARTDVFLFLITPIAAIFLKRFLNEYQYFSFKHFTRDLLKLLTITTIIYVLFSTVILLRSNRNVSVKDRNMRFSPRIATFF